VIGLFHDAALEFHGESERAVVEGEVFRKQGEAFDRFVFRKLRGKALYFAVDEGTDPRVRGHCGI